LITLPFKTVSPLFEMEKSGEKPFTVRKIDYLDSRFAILKRYMDQPTRTEPIAIAITNPATGETFIRRLRTLEYLRLSPGWLIIYLGELVKS